MDLCTRGLRVEFWGKSKEKLSRLEISPPPKGRLVLKFPVILFSPTGGRTIVWGHNGELWHPLQLHKPSLTVLHHITASLTATTSREKSHLENCIDINYSRSADQVKSHARSTLLGWIWFFNVGGHHDGGHQKPCLSHLTSGHHNYVNRLANCDWINSNSSASEVWGALGWSCWVWWV